MQQDDHVILPVALEAEIKDIKDRAEHKSHDIHAPLQALTGKPPSYEGEKGDKSETGSPHREINAHGLEIPTEEELHTLRRVADELPLAAMLIVICEFAERFSYYGTTGVFPNYITRPLPEGGNGAGAIPHGPGHENARAGALNRGQAVSVAVTTFFNVWAYVMPVFGAIVADQYLGRFKTICWFTAIVGIGHVILVGVSAPSVLAGDLNTAFGLFMLSLIIIGVGTGGIKANVSALVAEQYTKTGQWIETRKSGERVVVDANLTIQRIFMWFYLFINVGSLGSIGTVYAELFVGFWLAWLIPTIVYLLLPIVLWAGYSRYVKTPPRGSIILEWFRVMRISYKGLWSWNPVRTYKNFHAGANWEAARPSAVDQKAEGTKKGITWDNDFVDEVRRTMYACKVFLLYPFFWISYNQMNNNLANQAAYMDTNGVPNDLLGNLNPLSIIILVPIFDRIIYPGLRRIGIVIRPVTRITLGFFTASLAMVYCAVLQHYINITNPCGEYGGTCDAGVSPLNVWIQGPAYILIGIAEIWASITGLEYAFTKAPIRMKSVVFAIFFLTTAVSNLLSLALAPVSVDPFVLWNYTGCAVASFISGIVFYILYRKLDNDEDTINAIGASNERRHAD